MVNIGDIFYTCASNIEAQGYNDYKPRSPYQVKIVQILDGNTIKAQCFNSETGIVDDDSNATVYVNPNEFYTTLEEATKHYRNLSEQHACGLLREVYDLVSYNKDICDLIETAIEFLEDKNGKN